MQAPTKLDVYAALTRKCDFEVLQDKETPTQLRFMGRLALDRWNFFVPVIHQLLSTTSQGWSCDVSKQYLLNNGKIMYAWRFIFQGASLGEHYAGIAAVINAAASPDRVELQSQLLPGYKEGDVRGGFNEKGKGAGSADSLPLALTRSR